MSRVFHRRLNKRFGTAGWNISTISFWLWTTWTTDWTKSRQRNIRIFADNNRLLWKYLNFFVFQCVFSILNIWWSLESISSKFGHFLFSKYEQTVFLDYFITERILLQNHARQKVCMCAEACWVLLPCVFQVNQPRCRFSRCRSTAATVPHSVCPTSGSCSAHKATDPAINTTYIPPATGTAARGRTRSWPSGPPARATMRLWLLASRCWFCAYSSLPSSLLWPSFGCAISVYSAWRAAARLPVQSVGEMKFRRKKNGATVYRFQNRKKMKNEWNSRSLYLRSSLLYRGGVIV